MPAAVGLAEFLPRLRDDLVNRRIRSGLSFLASRQAGLELLDPAEKGAARLLGYLAQWVDIGFASPALIECILGRFQKQSRSILPLTDYIHLRMAEGLVAMYADELDEAIRHFEFVGSLEQDVADAELLAISNFWIARCLRQEGRYDDALTYAGRAAQLAREAGFEYVAAVIQVLESWLVFQKAKRKEAAAILHQAEAVLNRTDDYVSRGNIQSSYGRIARREGKYQRALEHFERAIAEYKKQDPRHRNLARSLINISFVKRLIAVQLQRSVDRTAALRHAGRSRPDSTAPTTQVRSQIAEMRAAAFRDLDEAVAIYQEQHNRRGLAAVHVNRGFLHLDQGALDLAACESAEAFRIAEEKADYIQMARARLLQCMIENAKYDEQIEGASGPSQPARLADEYARDAIEFARHTQNRRLLARAYVWRGITLATDFFNDLDSSRQCCDAASALLKPEGEEDVWEDLQELRAKILHHGRVDTALQEWSQGLVGGKTFQQLTEEFAAIVIPKVWEREGRKVSRVAARLSVSPKKVRRVLQAAGLLSRGERE
jgi:tetratricopeptide (TPR) repeat protein